MKYSNIAEARFINRPNRFIAHVELDTHPEYGEALSEAKAAGVKVIFLCCSVEPDELVISNAIIAG